MLLHFNKTLVSNWKELNKNHYFYLQQVIFSQLYQVPQNLKLNLRNWHHVFQKKEETFHVAQQNELGKIYEWFLFIWKLKHCWKLKIIQCFFRILHSLDYFGASSFPVFGLTSRTAFVKSFRTLAFLSTGLGFVCTRNDHTCTAIMPPKMAEYIVNCDSKTSRKSQ